MVLLITNYSNHLNNWLKNFVNFIEENGHEVKKIVERMYDNEDYYSQFISMKDCEHVFMWNGEEFNHSIIKNLCVKHGVKYSILEVGFFPQKDFYIIDRKGINANSSVIYKNINVSSEDVLYYEKFRSNYLSGRAWSKKNQYILAPMQLNIDTNIILHSPFKSMQEYIDHVEEKFKNNKIIFKRHPLDKNNYNVSNKNELITTGNILDVAQDAEMVYGINSTSLLETSMLGVPTVSIGNGFLKSHENNVYNLLVYLCKIQIPVSETNIKKWIVDIFPKFPDLSCD